MFATQISIICTCMLNIILLYETIITIHTLYRMAYFMGVATLLLASLTISPVIASGSVSIYPPDSKPYGLTHADHAVNFWKWLLPMPANNSPMEDPTGAKCTNGQENSNSSVFYLSHNSGGRSDRVCEIPAGKGLLIPVMEVEVSDKETPGATEQDLHNAAKKDQDSVNSLYLKIDDKEYSYEDLLKYRTHSNVFDVVFPDNGIYGVMKGGPSKAVADGFYILTEPIPAGNHTVHFKSSLICLDPDCVDPNYVQDVQYKINAK